MIKEVDNLLKNRNLATYQDYKNVLKTLRKRLGLNKYLFEDNNDCAKTYSEMDDYMEQIKLVKKEFPLFAQKDREYHLELAKFLGHNVNGTNLK